jgi:hypothetical protein
MPFTRSRQAALRGGRRSEAVPDEADSTVAHWAMPPRKRRRSDGLTGTCGVDWQSGLPEGPLLRVFELLHAEQANAAVSGAAHDLAGAHAASHRCCCNAAPVSAEQCDELL